MLARTCALRATFARPITTDSSVNSESATSTRDWPQIGHVHRWGSRRSGRTVDLTSSVERSSVMALAFQDGSGADPFFINRSGSPQSEPGSRGGDDQSPRMIHPRWIELFHGVIPAGPRGLVTGRYTPDRRAAGRRLRFFSNTFDTRNAVFVAASTDRIEP